MKSPFGRRPNLSKYSAYVFQCNLHWGTFLSFSYETNQNRPFVVQRFISIIKAQTLEFQLWSHSSPGITTEAINSYRDLLLFFPSSRPCISQPLTLHVNTIREISPCLLALVSSLQNTVNYVNQMALKIRAENQNSQNYFTTSSKLNFDSDCSGKHCYCYRG